MKILLVDDHPQVENDVRRALHRIGVDSEVVFVCPRDPEEVLSLLPSGEELGGFECALVDLELDNAMFRKVHYEPRDLQGGTEVLPYLRREAPWLPAIGYSRLFHGSAQHFLAIASGFGFDVTLQSQLLGADKFDRALWDEVVGQAKVRRRRALQEEEYRVRGKYPSIEVASTDEARLGEKWAGWRSVLRDTFYFADAVVLERLEGGFSGADVFRAYVRGEGGGAAETAWLWKVDGQIAKLHKEARAHVEARRSGVEFARMVPLLWRGVVAEGGVGCLAYQFARQTSPAADVLALEGIGETAKRCGEVLGELYGEGCAERRVLGRLLRETGFNWSEIASAIESCDLAVLARKLADGVEEGVLGETIRYTKGRIHGDLHLGNILLGRHSVVIDFARSCIGPIAVDASRLVCDFVLRCESIRGGRVPKWDDVGQGGLADLGPIREEYELLGGDEKLFAILLCFELGRALSYEDIGAATKDWIRTVVKREGELA
jgi:hypothetical protein